MKDYYVLSQHDIHTPATVSQKILDLVDVPWASRQLWAPDATEKEETYYLFFPAKDKTEYELFRIGVAMSDTPDGVFEAEPNYIEGTYSIDPAILADDDGSVYMYFGGLWGGQLQCWNNNTFNASELGPNAPTTGLALGPRFAKLSDDLLSLDGEVKELVFIDQDGEQMKADSPRRFFEASSVNKINDLYYYQYSTGDSHTIEIAVSDSPEGPFTWNSTLLQPVVGWTTHESITKFKGEWLLYYADASLSGQDNLRNTKVRELVYEDGTIELAQPQPSTNTTSSKMRRVRART